MCKSLTGGILKNAFDSQAIALWVCARMFLLANWSETLLVFSPLPGWEHADLHPAFRWSKCALLFYCLGNFTDVKRSAHLCMNIILVETCQDSHTS